MIFRTILNYDDKSHIHAAWYSPRAVALSPLLPCYHLPPPCSSCVLCAPLSSIISSHNPPPPPRIQHILGEWEGTVMVMGVDGECRGAGLCTGMFIHPEVVMTAGHCCETGATKAICTGKIRLVRVLLLYIRVRVRLRQRVYTGNFGCG